MFHAFRESLIRYFHRRLSDINVLISQNQWEFINISDNKLLATAELERHYLQHGREKYNMIDLFYNLYM